jgi:membrane protease subunit HflK
MGIYQIDAQERGVVFFFGKVQDELLTEGINFKAPILYSVEVVNVTRVRSKDHQALMLTEDENIVDVSLTVQWVVEDAVDFTVNVKDPERSLDNATESALRHVVGSSSMNEVITDGREAIAIEVQDRLQTYLRNYGTGIFINKVNVDRSAPPGQVQDAFNDVQKAKEDKQKYINQSNAYAQAIVPEARGKAQRQIQEASAYRDQVIAQAEGEAERFEKLLAEYKLAKTVTRDRLYIDALESVFSNSSKVMVDVEGGNNMMYLPLDRLTERREPVQIDQDAVRQATEELRREINNAANRSTSNRSRSGN